jgi:hypothetical protein
MRPKMVNVKEYHSNQTHEDYRSVRKKIKKNFHAHDVLTFRCPYQHSEVSRSVLEILRRFTDRSDVPTKLHINQKKILV